MHRRRFLALAVGTPVAASLAGCDSSGSIGTLDLVWGRRGISDGRFQKPRAMTIDRDDLLYIVDMTARIQVFTADGQFVRRWQTPVHTNGRPTGVSIDRAGNVVVPDTHYFRVLVYSPQGELLETQGGTYGNAPGEFGLVTDTVQDSAGNRYVSEYGEYDRIQKFSPSGEFLLEWGGHGGAPSQFARPQSMAIDAQDRIWVADACNHRVQVFDSSGRLERLWGQHGSTPGRMAYPYGLILDGQGHVYISEFGNHRVQKFTLEGESLGCWGHAGRGPGELINPWAVARDSHGRIHVLDTNNHRVQRIYM